MVDSIKCATVLIRSRNVQCRHQDRGLCLVKGGSVCFHFHTQKVTLANLILKFCVCISTQANLWFYVLYHVLALYTTECVDFLFQRPGLLPMVFPEPPEPAVVPSCKWLLSVYSQDFLTRLQDIKARITSIYGNILKMDSTKRLNNLLCYIGYIFCFLNIYIYMYMYI